MKSKSRYKKYKNYRINLLMSLACFLSCLSLLSVGYGSWSLSDYTEFNDVNIQVGNVLNLPNYIKNFKIDTFKISPDGLVKDETIVYEGEIVLNFDFLIKQGLLLDYQPVSNAINLEIKMINNGTFNFFTTDFLLSESAVNYTIKDGMNVTTGSVNVAVGNEFCTFNIEYLADNINSINFLNCNFEINFLFDKFRDDFENLIYNNLGDNPMSFIVSMEVIK